MAKNKLKGKARTKLMKKEARIAQKAMTHKTKKPRNPVDEITDAHGLNTYEGDSSWN